MSGLLRIPCDETKVVTAEEVFLLTLQQYWGFRLCTTRVYTSLTSSPVSENETSFVSRAASLTIKASDSKLTRRQALLKLVSLLGVVDDEGVEVAGAADLELGLRARLLYPDRCLSSKARREEETESK